MGTASPFFNIESQPTDSWKKIILCIFLAISHVATISGLRLIKLRVLMKKHTH